MVTDARTQEQQTPLTMKSTTKKERKKKRNPPVTNATSLITANFLDHKLGSSPPAHF